MNYPMVTETTVRVSQFADSRGERDDIVLWNDEGLDILDPRGRGQMVWLENSTVIHELAYESGLLEVGSWTEEETQHFRDQEELRAAYEGGRFTPKDFINDPEIEEALDVWRSSGMDDLHDKSYFKEMVQGGESVWMTDARNQVQQFTPEMLEQRVDLNGLFDTDGGYDYLDKELELEIVGIGESHGVAKSKYGGVFVAKGVLKYLGPERGYIGYKFKCWCMFTNAKYPWRTSVNGVIVD